MDLLLLNTSMNSTIPEAITISSIWTPTEVFFLILVVGFTLLGVFGNILVICAWISNANISQNPSNALLLSLAVTDLTIAGYGIPFSHVFKLVGRWVFGEAAKLLLVVVTQSAVLVSSYHLVLIAVDRYRIVRHGLDYIKNRTTMSIMEPVPWLWFFGLWEITPILVAWWPNMNLLSFDKDLDSKTTGAVWETIKHPTFVSLHLFSLAILPILLVIVLYYKTFMELRRRLRKRLPTNNHVMHTASSTENANTEGTNLSEDESRVVSTGHNGTSQQRSVDSTQDEIKKKKMLKCVEQERKTATTLGILILAYLICWIPFLIVNLLYFIDVHVADEIHWMTKFLGMVNSCVNPVIYAFSNQDFNAAFRKILSGMTKCCRR